MAGASALGFRACRRFPRKLDEQGLGADRVAVTLIGCSAYHSIRVRNYEADLDDTRVQLDEGPAPDRRRARRDRGRRHRYGRRSVVLAGGAEPISYDRLVFALSSRRCVMSCQPGRPMGRFAGHNVACNLLGLLPLRIDWYTTILDLGPWGAVCTDGWDRHVATTGAAAKRTKRMMRERIYPPRSGDRRDILDNAAPVVQCRQSSSPDRRGTTPAGFCELFQLIDIDGRPPKSRG